VIGPTGAPVTRFARYRPLASTAEMPKLERRLERMVEGVFSRAFRSSLRPIELGRRLVREIDDSRTVDVKGRVVVPNVFQFRLSQQDAEQYAEIQDALVRELCDAAREYARDEAYVFMGPVEVTITADGSLKPGRFTLSSKLQEGVAGAVGRGSLVFGSGERMPLGDRTISIGRLPECEITLADPNVSRRHAEIRPSGPGYVVADLGSTNGTRVNGTTISEHRLQPGDEIAVGNVRIRYEP
jgi:hypothetical protein